MLNNAKRILAFLIFKLYRPLNKRKIWVIGASLGKRFSDNGAVFFRYILENHPGIEIYWIIEKDAPDIQKVKETGPFLYKNSIKGNLYTLLAEVLISTHSLPKDVSEYPVEKYKDAIKVFISHGIEGFKKKAPHHVEINHLYDISVAVSDFEKEIKVKEWKIPKEKVCVTGLPRYDMLKKHQKSPEKIKSIFYMPTWCPEYRKTFQKKYSDLNEDDIKKFKKQEYFKNIHGFVFHSRLADLLERENIKLYLFFHQIINPLMGKILSFPNHPFIKHLTNEAGIQEKIMESELLITDYSSVAWDFLYLEKPVIFYQFDQQKHLNITGSYVKMPEELFGPATYTPEETLQNIEKIVNGEDKYQEKRQRMKKKFFKYDDNKNSERMTECILNFKEKRKL